jgi:hypothetical protein
MNLTRLPIHHGRRLGLTLIGCILAILAVGAAMAEQPRITLESAIRYLQQDIFILPGVGFQKVQVGHSFQHVALTWGNPNQAYDSDVGSRIAWVYRVDNASEIALTGSTRVESIDISGSFNSSFTSREGANFGMTPHQVISIYGKPAEEGNLVKLRYPDKGITFGFKNGALRTMRVYSPKS